jgi:carbonic anhydrase/acetyltransferase-like protein (isoleucine patch superfamily)
VAPNATLCGDVRVGEGSRILFGSVLTAEAGPVEIGRYCIVMENTVLRGTARHPLKLGDHVLIGPRAYLTGCVVEDCVFIASGATIFNGARIGTGSEVRIGGVVHIEAILPADSVIPIGWVAVGDPVEILPPDRHEEIWTLQEPLDFPRTVFGLKRAPNSVLMPALTNRYGRFLGKHRNDTIVD